MAKTSKKIGTVTHYFSHLGVGIIKLSGELKVGDGVKFEGHTTNFKQKVSEMQFDHKDIENGKKGQEVGIKIDNKVRDGDKVYLVT